MLPAFQLFNGKTTNFRRNYEKLQENNHNAVDRSSITDRRFYDRMHQTVGTSGSSQMAVQEAAHLLDEAY